jgi:hypothetical protein
MKQAMETDMKNMHKSRNVCGALIAHLSVPRHVDTRLIQASDDRTLIDVEFHIMSTLPCEKPIIVKREWKSSQCRACL